MKIKNKLKTVILIIFWILFILLIPFIISKYKSSINVREDSSSYISSQYKIENCNITLDVDKNNKIDVTEEFEVNIQDDKSTYNGIDRTLPLYEKYYDSSNNLVTRKISITNLRAIGEKFVLDKKRNNVNIKIGSSKIKVSPGLHKYTIKYRYDRGVDINKNYDELFFKFLSSTDNNLIANNMKVNIKMPSEVTIDKIKFLNGQDDITSKVDFSVDKNLINASINGDVLSSNVNLKINLPDNYFVGSRNNYGTVSLIICICIIIVSLICFLLWNKNGKDNTKRASTVEFYPPDELDAAQVGYIYGEKSIKKLTTALIIELASKGYISIEKLDNKKYKLINTKKQNIEGNMNINEQIVYEEIFRNSDENILSEDKEFGKVFGKINKSIEELTDKNINDLNSKKVSHITAILLILSIIFWTISYIFVKDLDTRFNILYVISLIAIGFTGAFTIFMKRKTTYGEIIGAKVKGFRNYLNVVEKNKIDELVNENPRYFYDILPYAYVLNISKRWIGLFEKENICNVDIELLDCYQDDFIII